MSIQDAEDVGRFVEFLQRPDGVYVLMKPGASRIPLDRILALARARSISRIDVVRLKAAWIRSEGLPLLVAPLPSTPNSPGAPVPRSALVPATRVLFSAADQTALAAPAAVLSRQGLEPSRSSGLERALFEATRHRPDAIVVDTSLGIGTALKTCRLLASDPRTTAIPVLISCQEATAVFLRQALDAGAKDVMVHPISTDMLTRKLTKVLEAVGKCLPESAGPNEGETVGAEDVPRELGKVNLAKFLKDISKIRAIPAVVERVVRISSDVHRSGARELARVVSMDQAATALVLRVANSFAFGASQQIDSLDEAVTRIGFRQTRSLVVGNGVMQSFGTHTHTASFDRLGCWRHALASAILAKQIAEHDGHQVASDLAFIAGLLHDVGRVLLDEFCSAEFEDAVRTSDQKRISLTDAEREILQTTHVEVARQALRAWKFPDDIIDAVRFHHGTGLEDAGLPGDRKMLCQAIYAANFIAKATGIGHGGGDTFIGEIPESVWDQLKLGGGLPKTFWTRFDREFRQCHSFLGVTYEDVPGVVASRGLGLVSEDEPVAVSLLLIALESAGWTVARAPEAGSLPTDVPAGGPAFVVVRSRSAESLAVSMQRWEPVAGTAPLVGVLSAGCTALRDRPCLVEPYDRDDLMNLLPKPAAGSRSGLQKQ